MKDGVKDESSDQARELTARELEAITGGAGLIRRAAPIIGKIARVSAPMLQDASGQD
jgi:hypothetical protein